MSDVACTHCNLTFSQDVMIHEEAHYFCCKGCQGVFHLLNDEGLDTFYDKLGDTKLQPAIEHHDDLEKFDLEGLQK